MGGLHSLFGSLLEGRGKGFERIWRSSLQPSNLLFFIFFKLRDLGRIGYALNEFFCTGLFTVKNLSNFKNVYHFPILSIYIKSYLLHSFLPYNQTRKEGGGRGGEVGNTYFSLLSFIFITSKINNNNNKERMTIPSPLSLSLSLPPFSYHLTSPSKLFNVSDMDQ